MDFWAATHQRLEAMVMMNGGDQQEINLHEGEQLRHSRLRLPRLKAPSHEQLS
jgi:hypothetical protein